MAWTQFLLRDSDIPRRGSLGRSREIARWFGADLDGDEPMTLQDAADELGAVDLAVQHTELVAQDDDLKVL